MHKVAIRKPSALLMLSVFVLFFGGSWMGSSGVTLDHVGTEPPNLALFAGHMGGQGNVDGRGVNGRFFNPFGIAADASGNAYVADTSNHVIRKISPTGDVSVFAGSFGVTGSTDGPGSAASFNSPNSVAIDVFGNVYVADSHNHTIRKITHDGVVSTLAGTAGVTGSNDGTGSAASFNCPNGVAADSTGNIYVADTNNSTIRKITAGGVVSTFAGSPLYVGSSDGAGSDAAFSYPFGVATDRAGYVYVADSNNHIIRIITPAGVVSTLAGLANAYGSTDGEGIVARFNFPNGISADGTGIVYVADSGNSTIRKIIPTGIVSTYAGLAGAVGSVDGAGSEARFMNPSGVATDMAGNVYVADTYNHAIRRITSSGAVSTLAGSAVVLGSVDGAGGAAGFNLPTGISADSAGNVYMADTVNHIIRKATPDGVVTTISGKAGVPGNTDAMGAAARFNYPFDVAADHAGNIFVADTSNHTIRKITPAGAVSTFAGTAGVTGSSNGRGVAASFNFPHGVATDLSGNVYVADNGNSIIRKITPAGLVSTFAGTAGVFGGADGTRAAASFKNPGNLATDSQGNLYVTDSDNNTIRKITPSGVVSTLAGMAGSSGSSDGTGVAARFNKPGGITTDATGNLYVADTYNHTIRKITPDGMVTTVAGKAGLRGSMSGELPAYLSYPKGVAVSAGLLYITLYNGVAVVLNRP